LSKERHGHRRSTIATGRGVEGQPAAGDHQPDAAGAALYVNKALGKPFVTFLVAFTVAASGITSTSTAAIAFGGDYLGVFVELPVLGVAIAAILVLAAINYRGINESIKVNLGLTAVEIAGLLIIVGIGVAALVNGTGEPSRAMEFNPDTSAALAILGGASLAFFALIGFEELGERGRGDHQPPACLPSGLVRRAAAGQRHLLVRGLHRHDGGANPAAGGLRRAAAGGGARRAAGDPSSGVLGLRPGGGHQHGTDQHDHGLPAAVRDGQAEHRAVAAGSGQRSPDALRRHCLHHPGRLRPGGHRRARHPGGHHGAVAADRLHAGQHLRVAAPRR
jgi:hypothetical protein